jgi:hypothetical protein
MRKLPRWHNLKHFNTVTTTTFADGESFLHILKVILCPPLLVFLLMLITQGTLYNLVQLLAKNDAMIHCIRDYQQYRMIINLNTSTGERVARLKKLTLQYNQSSSASLISPSTIHIKCLP